MATLVRHHITPIDLVVVNLYPFVKAAANPGIVFGELLEEIDIGGPSMVRSAAKNFQDVLVVVDPADYDRCPDELGRAEGPASDISLRARQEGFRSHGCVRYRHRGHALGNFAHGPEESSAFIRSAEPPLAPPQLAIEPQQDQGAPIR